ncbi:hypothetical protein HYS97_01695 [Candidatus Daviesbacteria bacterium]|nr:hypothetical protein [Candidatus Daviesbacteria bacterium]
MSKFLTYLFNFLIGVVGIGILVTKLTGVGKGVEVGQNAARFDVKFDTTGFIIWVVLLILYFYLSRKYWGKTVGGLIASKLLGKKK